MRLLVALLATQAVLAVIAVRSAPRVARAREGAAILAVVACWVSAVALFVASRSFGGAPI